MVVMQVQVLLVLLVLLEGLHYLTSVEQQVLLILP